MAKKSKVSIEDFVYYEEEESQPLNIIAKNIKKEITDIENNLSAQNLNKEDSSALDNPLDRRETGVSSALDKPLDRRETGVSSALDKKSIKPLGVSSALDKPLDNPLDRRETGVSSALDIQGLVGKEKVLMFFLADECRKRGDLETNFIGSDKLKNLLSLDSLGLRNLIFRVKEKGFIEVTAKQLGRVGLRKFKISRSIYQQGIDSALDRRETGVSSALDKPLDKPLETVPCSSSNIDINNTTTTEDHFFSIPPKLQGQLPLQQIRAILKSGVIDQTTLEDSLWGFAHDLEKGLVKSKTGNTTGLFIGALKNGGYISQQYLSQKQQEVLELKERVEEFKKLRAELESNQLVEEFEAFKVKYPEKAEQLRPSGKFVKSFESGSIGYRMWIDEYKRSLETNPNADFATST